MSGVTRGACLPVKSDPIWVEHVTVTKFEGRLLTLPTHIRQGFKTLFLANNLAYFDASSGTDKDIQEYLTLLKPHFNEDFSNFLDFSKF